MSVQEELKKLYIGYNSQMNKLDTKLVKLIIKYVNDGLTASQAIDKALTSSKYFSAVNAEVINSITNAALIGYGVLPGADNAPVIKEKTLNEAWASDKMKLSTRLHGSRIQMRMAIIDTVSAGFIKLAPLTEIKLDLYDGYNSGKTTIKPAELPNYLQRIVDMSRQVMLNGEMPAGYKNAIENAKNQITKMEKNNAYPSQDLRETYKQLIDAVENLNETSINQHVSNAVDEKSRYYADRIAQTEQSRAAREAFIDKHSQNEDVFGFQWRLNSSHRVFDICDFLANADFGYGKGIYPKDKIPKYPAHPFCRCYFSVVYKHQIKDYKEFDEEQANRYLDSIDEEQRKSLFTINGYKSYKTGGKWQNYLLGWGGYEDINRFSTEKG